MATTSSKKKVQVVEEALGALITIGTALFLAGIAKKVKDFRFEKIANKSINTIVNDHGMTKAIAVLKYKADVAINEKLEAMYNKMGTNKVAFGKEGKKFNKQVIDMEIGVFKSQANAVTNLKKLAKSDSDKTKVVKRLQKIQKSLAKLNAAKSKYA